MGLMMYVIIYIICGRIVTLLIAFKIRHGLGIVSSQGKIDLIVSLKNKHKNMHAYFEMQFLTYLWFVESDKYIFQQDAPFNFISNFKSYKKVF